jgi:serine/threonine-protein kinase
MGCLTASVPLHRLVATSHPYRYLALEDGCPNGVLVVDLMPFRMLRHRVDSSPHWLFETAIGYGLLSQEGEFLVINDEGRIINHTTGLPRPQAVVARGTKSSDQGRSPTQYLWSVNQGETSRVYTVDLSHLAPDILF